MGREGNNFNFFEEASRLDTNLGTDSDPVSKLQNDILAKTPVLKEEVDEEEVEDTDAEEVEQEEETEENDVDDTEEETEETEETENVEEVFEVFATNLVTAGILTPREDDDVEYPPNEEGIQLLVEHTIEDKVTEELNSYKEIVLNPVTNATLGDLLKFKEEGGDIKDFFATGIDVVDYDEIDLDDENNQINLIVDKARLEGLEDSEIEELVEDYKVAGQLSKQAKIAHRILAKHQQTEFENLKKQQELNKKQQQEVQTKRVEEFKQKVFSISSIGSIQLNEKEKTKFYDYLTKPVKKSSSGELLTQFEIDNDAETKRLEMAFVMFKGGVGSIEKKVKSEVSGGLKMALSKTKDTMLSRNSGSTPSEETEIKTKKSSKIFVPDFELFS
jgi:hypothetical protein